MRSDRQRILIAAPVAVIREIASLFAAEDAETIGAESWEHAVRVLDEVDPDLIIVCYAFDEVHPFRLLHYLRQDLQRAHVPTVLVRALPVTLGKTQEAEMRESYRTLGVDELYNLYDEKVRRGVEPALRQFRDFVYRLARLREKPRDAAAGSHGTPAREAEG